MKRKHRYKDPLRTPDINSLNDIEIFKKTLKIGTTYKIAEVSVSEGKEGRKKYKKEHEMRLVAKYPHVATLEDEYGRVASWNYWKLQKLIKGEANI